MVSNVLLGKTFSPKAVGTGGQYSKLSSQPAWFPIPALPFVSCVTSGKLLKLSDLQYLIC